jgi:hypothetical protein
MENSIVSIFSRLADGDSHAPILRCRILRSGACGTRVRPTGSALARQYEIVR